VSLQPATDNAVEWFISNYKKLIYQRKTDSADMKLLRKVAGFNVQQKYRNKMSILYLKSE